MNHYYADIISRIADPILWWDECAVPRFCGFNPVFVANIYADEAALILIACKECGTEFRVAAVRSTFDRHINRMPYLANDIKNNRIVCGHPPNAHCCDTGPTVHARAIRVLEYWQKNSNFEWNRVEEYEIDLEDAGE